MFGGIMTSSMKKKLLYIGIGIAVIVALGFIIPPPDGFWGATSTISVESVATLYNQSTDIKAEYQLSEVSLIKTDIKNAELDRYRDEPKDEVKITIGNNLPVGTLGADAEFKPNIELKRWNEVSFKIKTDNLLKDIATEDKQLSFDKDKIKFDTPKISFEMYDYTEGEGGYKYIWYLNEKPLTNKIEFQIESSGLDFFYQPPLNEENTDPNLTCTETQCKDADDNIVMERPENVVGSYAVYHSTKGGMNDAYGKDYKVGKAFHIYRPHLIDANGLEAWGILKIENGIYSVEIPQDFLDTAVYPIKSNDDFGWTAQGGSTNIYANTNYIWYSPTTNSPTFNGVADSMSIYVAKNASEDTGVAIKMALYSGLTSYVAETGEVLPLSTTIAKLTSNFTSPPLIYSASSYLFPFNGTSSSNYYAYAFDALGVTNKYKSNTYTNSWPADITGLNGANRTISIYATYTAAGGTPAVKKVLPPIILEEN